MYSKNRIVNYKIFKWRIYMFDEIGINGKVYNIFFDIHNMILYTGEPINNGEIKDEKTYEIFTVLNKYKICIDCDTLYLSEDCRVNYYNVIYYFKFENDHYIGGVKEINKIRYYSVTLQNYMLPVYENDRIEYKADKVEMNDVNGITEVNMYKKCEKKYFDEDNFDSYIEVNFDKTDDVEYIYKICQALDNWLKLSVYSKSICKPKILIYNEEDSMEMGILVINPLQYEKISVKDRIGLYNQTDKKAIRFFLENSALNLNYLPCEAYRRNYSIGDFINLYSAFEYESNKVYVSKEIDDRFEIIKDEICKYAEKLKKEKSGEEKEFLNLLINNRIRSYGCEYGHRQKIKSAFTDYFSEFPQRVKFYKLKDNMKKIVDKIYELRTKIIHDNECKEFSEEENKYIQYFEWIICAMLFKRIGLNTEEIEERLDSIFGVG